MTGSSPSGRSAIGAVLAFTFRHWRRQAWLAAAIATGILLSTVTDILVPVFAGRLVDAVAAGLAVQAARDEALAAFIAIGLLGLSALAFRHLAFLGIVRFTSRMMADVAVEAFQKVQRLSTNWHANSFAGSTVRRISRGMWALDTLNDTILISLIPSLTVLVGSAALLGWQWPLMGLVVAAGSIGVIGMSLGMSLIYVAPAASLSNQWDTRIGGALADAVGCNAVVKAFGAEAREDDRLAGILSRWGRRTRRHWVRATNAGTAQAAVMLALRVAVVGGALWLWLQGEAGAGDVAYMLTAFFVIQGYLRDVGNQIRTLQRSVNELEELVDLHGEPPGVADRPGAGAIAITRGEVRFEDVGFHYGSHATPLFTGLNVSIAPGEKVGLVGHSGSGKTTFVKLIQRLYDVTGGRILIDGQDIGAAAQASLRGQIAIVQQEPILFHRSLSENIAYGRPGASGDEIAAAARLANAHDFIMRLPAGYATLVGERGVKLSGGERQRIALARAFLADARILILDEATSSLDSESEALVQQAVERLMANRTTIVIAHRLSTVQAMDRILVFDRGRIVEEGDHPSLSARTDGIYRRLFERQAMGLMAARAS